VSLFISFVGGEGSGKSTQAERLAQRLRAHGYAVLKTYEPGGTTLGDELRRLLKDHRSVDLAPESELLLFAAARSQLTREVIQPALAEGAVVICDRYMDSTTAYQGYGRELPPAVINSINHIATGGLRPDLVVLLDMRPDESLKRKRQPRDRIEIENAAFHQRVRDGYLELAKSEPERWLVLDAATWPDEVEQAVWARVAPLLPEKPPNDSH
jgi:dTMP kinase